ncbi:hypothetical protein VNI00_004355 [Paramarasmius palmivorus]|uniref:Uncharacterized protein n=1 Tax=Paramarasmius palmivorus TaxID=297713 RepID=A0AAW0DP54_9AGAR
MFGLVRRISNSFIPRPDRPWEEDATSNAPKIGRKRRRSMTDREQDAPMDGSSKKKVRGDTPVVTATDGEGSTPAPQPETEAVKEVTKGVKGVELEDKDKVEPESVPLPDEVAGELDSSSIASTPPPESEATKVEEVAAVANADAVATEAAETDTVTEPQAKDAVEEKEDVATATVSGTEAPTTEASVVEESSEKAEQLSSTAGDAETKQAPTDSQT